MLQTKVFEICCVLIVLRFQIFFFFWLIVQFYTLNFFLFHFDHSIHELTSAFFSKLFTPFLSKIAKTAVFALWCETSIVEVRLHFNFV